MSADQTPWERAASEIVRPTPGATLSDGGQYWRNIAAIIELACHQHASLVAATALAQLDAALALLAQFQRESCPPPLHP